MDKLADEGVLLQVVMLLCVLLLVCEGFLAGLYPHTTSGIVIYLGINIRLLA
jgi:hypothetical protein